jgi:hypothetical protein
MWLSKKGQGRASYGRAVYTGDIAVAADYRDIDGESGVITALPITADFEGLNILNWDEVKDSPFMQKLQKRAEKEKREIFDILAKEHGIDIILRRHRNGNKLVMLQNSDAIRPPKNLGEVIENSREYIESNETRPSEKFVTAGVIMQLLPHAKALNQPADWGVIRNFAQSLLMGEYTSLARDERSGNIREAALTDLFHNPKFREIADHEILSTFKKGSKDLALKYKAAVNYLNYSSVGDKKPIPEPIRSLVVSNITDGFVFMPEVWQVKALEELHDQRDRLLSKSVIKFAMDKVGSKSKNVAMTALKVALSPFQDLLIQRKAAQFRVIQDLHAALPADEKVKAEEYLSDAYSFLAARNYDEQMAKYFLNVLTELKPTSPKALAKAKLVLGLLDYRNPGKKPSAEFPELKKLLGMTGGVRDRVKDCLMAWGKARRSLLKPLNPILGSPVESNSSQILLGN